MATILVVDDEMGIRELLSEILSDEGHVVETAENARVAEREWKRGKPRLPSLGVVDQRHSGAPICNVALIRAQQRCAGHFLRLRQFHQFKQRRR